MPWLQHIFYVFLTTSSISSIYLYNYAIIQGCQFPSPTNYQPSLLDRITTIPNEKHQAPFRLLALGDPQLEGDTSFEVVIANTYAWDNLRFNLANRTDKIGVLTEAAHDLFFYGIPVALRSIRKSIDLFGNDYYLAHIYRTLKKQTNPTHVAVLGDLLGSQWIDDDEFDARAHRYWNRVIPDGLRVEDAITAEPTVEVLGNDHNWRRRIINIAGNHDIGYAGDITRNRTERFERQFGAVNWEIVFEAPGLEGEPAFLRLIILNSMNLDTRAVDEEIQGQTYAFLNDVIQRSEPVENRSVGTILLTHIPFYKEAGVCVDAPYFGFYDEGLVAEQNHLSDYITKSLLEGIYGMSSKADSPYQGLGRNGIIVNGHDHEGCDVWHHLPRVSAPFEPDNRAWNASRWENSLFMSRGARKEQQGQYSPGIREVTLRSMMGEYGGWGYLISAWMDPVTKEWRFEVNRCSAGVQHIWWAVHILILLTAGIAAFLVLQPTIQPWLDQKFNGVIKQRHALEQIVNPPKKTPSIEIHRASEEPADSPTPDLRPPSPFAHFNGNMQISGGRARKQRRPS